MLRARHLVGAAVLLTALIAGYPNSRGGGPRPARGVLATTPVGRAPALFAQRCARCHDQDGTGSELRSTTPTLPNFTELRWQQRRSDAQMVVSILEGRGTRMPAFGDRLSRVDARALVAHIRTLAPQEAVGVTVVAIPDVHDRFRELEEEFERLRKQFHELSRTNR
jgi:mono/diheme cytochrome c family protein